MTDPLRDQLQQALAEQYRIDRELGGGGMSRVFLATELALDRRVVLKILPPELASGVSVVRFKREISMAARLQHAHIVPLHSAGEAAGLPWFSMPYVEGESLRARLGRGELPIAEAVRTMRDVASALAYAHGKGVVHRDIKPENVLVADGSATVTDFGVAKALVESQTNPASPLTSVGVALGTPAYMSPEQAAGDERTDHRADIYAFGVVAYEMLAGRNPFAGRSPQATLAAHMTETPAPVEQARQATPPALAQLVNRCLAKSAADRPQSAQEIVHALDALVTPTGTNPLAAASGAAYPAATSRIPRVALIAVGIVVIAAGAWFAFGRTRGPDVDARRVAVIPFENLTGDSALSVVGRVAAEELSRSIAQTDSADVLSSGAIEAALSGEGGTSGDVAQRVARATRAGIIVTGNYSRSGDSLRMQASLINTRTGAVIRALDPTTGPVSDPMIAIGALRERLLGAIVSGDLARKVVLASTPPKYAAYVQFMEASRVFMGDNVASRPLTEKAIAIDPTYAQPYHMLARSYANVGMFDSAAAVAGRLEALRQQLSSYDRAILDFLQSDIRRDAPELVKLAQSIYARSGDPVYAYFAAINAIVTNDPGVAIPALRESQTWALRVGMGAQARDEAQAWHLAGEYKAELAASDSGLAHYPAGWGGFFRTARLRAFAGLKEAAAALAFADTLLRGQPNALATAPLQSVLTAALEFDAHGDSAAGVQLARKVTDWALTHAPVQRSVNWERVVGQAYMAAGQIDSALAHLQRALPDTSLNGITVAGNLAQIAARRGDSARARAISDSLGARVRKWDYGTTPFVQASIAAELGERDRAIQILTGLPRMGQSMASWHSSAALRSLRGYPSFEALITPKK